MDQNLTGIQRRHFASFALCHFAARLLLSLPPVKCCDGGGTVYSCIIKAEPLRVINTLQKSCNVLSLSLSFFLKQSLSTNFKQKKKKMQPQLESSVASRSLHTLVRERQPRLHVLKHAWKLLKPVKHCGWCKATHKQQTLLTALAPLHRQEKKNK